MAPAPQQPRALRIQQHDEGLGQRVDLNAVAGLPLGGRWAGRMVRCLDHSTKAGVLPVDDPSAVARLDDDLIHGVSIP